ncbi:Acylphosphatase [Paraburkholderia domus]|nr:acylphosphatase [Burkholderia sp. R-70006]CAE6767560.1 Acylphosphatase [Paraburkholderia domus]
MEADDKDGMLETRLVRVRGRVQGNGYRVARVHRAQALGVMGWVRNPMDDSVVAMLQGSPEELADMCPLFSEDSSAALVDELEVTRSVRQEPDCCIGGHPLVPYKQYAQQSPGFGLRNVLQCSHS